MLRKTYFLFLCFRIPSAIGSPFWYNRTEPAPGPTSVLTTSGPSLPPMGLQNRNAAPPRFCDEEPCMAIKIIHGVTTTSPCEGQIGCVTSAKGGLMGATFVPAVKSTTTRVPITESTSSKNTPTRLDEATTFYVYVTEAIKPTSSSSTISATTLVSTSITSLKTASLVSSILLPVNNPYTAGVAKTSSTQSLDTPSGILQSSARIDSTPFNLNPPAIQALSTAISPHFQSLTTSLPSLSLTFKTSTTLTSASAIPGSSSPPTSTQGLISAVREVSAMPVATHPPAPLIGVDRISSVITDISLLMSILTAEASTPSLTGSRQTLNVGSFAFPTSTLLAPPAATGTHVSSTLPAPLPVLGIAEISSVITDITLLESILAATSVPPPASTQTRTKTSQAMPSPSSHTPAPPGGMKSITSTRTITRTASPLAVTGVPNWVGNPLWGAGKTAVECTCQCRGQKFNLMTTKPV